jgi:hypothetical protein
MDQNNIETNELIQLISSSLSQSNESSNIILQAISQGISTGLSQGIASGNVKFSFQDIISLASIFKPNNEVPLQLISKLVFKDDTAIKSPHCNQDSTIQLSKGSTVETAASHDSHDSIQDSSGLPSSVHVFDVTGENCRALEPLEYHRVSETANDIVHNNSLSHASSISDITAAKSLPTSNTTRKRTVIVVSDNETLEPLRSRKRCGNLSSALNDGIENATDLIEYISSSRDKPAAVIEAHKKVVKKNGTLISSSFCLYMLFKFFLTNILIF